MDEILYGYGFSYVHLRVTPLVNIAKAVAVENLVLQGLELRRSCANLTMSGPQNFCASSHPPCARHTCQHITGLWSLHRQFWRWWSIIIYITIVEVDNKLIRAQQNGEISLGAHSEVLTQCIPIASPPVQCAATMPKLHHGRSPVKGGHYRDSSNNFSNRLSQLLQTDALHCHGHSLSNGVMSLVTGMLATFGATSGRPRNRVIGISKAKGRSLAIRTHCIFHEYIEKQNIVKALSNKTNVVTNPQGSSLVSY